MGENKVGLQARLMSQALRKLTATVSKTRTTCIFINQLREKIGVMFGNPETTTGGRSEEHTSELQSRQYLVCRLLLEKKKETRHLRPSLPRRPLFLPYSAPAAPELFCSPSLPN